MFTATIWRTQFRGERFFHGRVDMPGRGARPVRVFSIEDQANQNAVCLEVLEWAQRMGKTEKLKWIYENRNDSKYF